ncbi:MAG TPA: amidohydrolase family protein [Verrucomicrobiae bacterium]|jgi:imidazolonepropionase-like amidohydrolase|nr:amidohydrolase family protein [Verrucomicrobiae bacterium]
MRTRVFAECCTVVFVALAVALGLAPDARGQGGEPPYFAIRGAKIVTVSGRTAENSTVIISRGIITTVAADAKIPDEAWIIDGKGLTVYPGLIDSFTDVGLMAPPAPGAPAASTPGATESAPRPPQTQTAARGPEDRPGTTPWRNAADEVNLADKRIDAWRNGGFTTVVAAPKGGFFPGQAAVLDIAGDRAGDFVVKSPVAIPLNLSVTGGFGSGFPSSLMGVLAYVRQVFLDTDWSTRAQAAYEHNPHVERPPYDRSNASLAAALQKHVVVLIPANNSVQIQRSLELADRWKVNGVIYGAQMAYENTAEIAAKKLPVLVNAKWPEAEKDADPEDKPTLRELRFRDRAPSAPVALAKANVKFAFYSGGLTTPQDVLKAVKKSIDAGLPADAALRALTLSAAEIYGVSDRMGSIEVGKIANLVVTDGDLFDEKTKIKMVFVDGRRFEAHQPEKPKDPPKGDISGKWKLAFNTPHGPEEATADLSMEKDGTISGTVTSSRGTGSILNGYASADKFSFSINIPIEGNPLDVTFSGTFDATSMKGLVSVTGFSTDFTGTKPGAPSSASATAGAL